MNNLKCLFLLLLVQSMICRAVPNDTLSAPLPAHAHNDYMHERPLFDALENGFRSIEADVFSMGDSLYVAHDRRDIQPGRTLRALYLEPLMKCFEEDRLTRYDQGNPLILLVDIKDNGESTYRHLDRILKDFQIILCQLSPEGYVEGKVMLIVSGNRPIETMGKQTERFAFVDGRMKDLAGTYSSELMPLISDRWTKYFSWKGKGEMPEKERAQLRSYVNQAHNQGQLIRFWATPDKPGEERDAIWRELIAAGVDLINTDDLSGLRSFFLAAGSR